MSNLDQPRDENVRWTDTASGGMSWKSDKGTDVKLEGTRMTASAGVLTSGHDYDGYGPVMPHIATALKEKKQDPSSYVQLKGSNTLFHKSDTDRLDEATRRVTKYRETQKAEFVKAVPGYQELRDEHSATASHRESIKLAIEKGGRLPPARESKINELAKKYPAAAVYHKAESYSSARNDMKAAAGKNAMGRIKKGEDPTKVESDMEEEWNRNARKAVDAS